MSYDHAERFTNCDIEMYVADVTEGWDNTDGIDVEATQAKAEELIRDAVMDAFPSTPSTSVSGAAAACG